MKYFFEIEKNNIKVQNIGLKNIQEDKLQVFYDNLSEDEIKLFLEAYKKNNFKDFLSKTQKNGPLIFINDRQKNIFFAFNDKMSSNSIFYVKNSNKFFISDNPRKIFEISNLKPEIDNNSVYEFISYYSIVPPSTIYKNLKTIPIGSFLEIDFEKEESIKQYWNLEEIIKNKSNNYENFVRETRSLMVSSIEEDLINSKETGLALSSGIDSSGILGIIKNGSEKDVKTITVAPYGLDYKDYIFAKQTSEHFNSENFPLIPKFSDIKKIKDFSTDLPQPIEGGVLFAYGLILDKAKEIGLDTVFMGHGAEMSLGNLKISKVLYKTRFLRFFLPKKIRNTIFSLIAKFKGFSSNQLNFLKSNSLTDRFLIARGPMFQDVKSIFKYLDEKFLESFKTKAKEIEAIKNLSIYDKVVLMYLNSWVNYSQVREYKYLQEKFNVYSSMPFDNPRVVEKMLSAKISFRKKNNWNKQAIRDMFRPFVSEKILNTQVGSLIIRYNKWFEENREPVFNYFYSSKILKNSIDLDILNKKIDKMLEPGLIMMRLLTLAVWYDSNWDKENLKNFDSIFLAQNNNQEGND